MQRPQVGHLRNSVLDPRQFRTVNVLEPRLLRVRRTRNRRFEGCHRSVHGIWYSVVDLSAFRRESDKPVQECFIVHNIYLLNFKFFGCSHLATKCYFPLRNKFMLPAKWEQPKKCFRCFYRLGPETPRNPPRDYARPPQTPRGVWTFVVKLVL